MSEKLQEVTMKMLNENKKKLSKQDEIAFANKCKEAINKNIPIIKCKGIDTEYGIISLDIECTDKKYDNVINVNVEVGIVTQANWEEKIEATIYGSQIYQEYDTYVNDSFYEEDIDNKFCKALQRFVNNKMRAYDKAEERHKNTSTNNLKWEVIDEDPKTYHAEKGGYYFNIYEQEDNTYNLIVDFKDYELQDLDDIFDTLEDAKKKAEEIFKEDSGSDYED